MATPHSTAKYFNRLAKKNIPSAAIRTLGKTQFRVSGTGFGGYRIHHDSVEHAKALRYALLNGFNLIDTSSNYSDGGSEMLIGNLVSEMMERKEIYRDEIVIVSKAGYAQGQNLAMLQTAEEDNRSFPEVVKYSDGCWHCIHPEYLEDQLSRTLERLNMPALDVYLLHNPEYYLYKAKQEGKDKKEAQSQYYHRIRNAFGWMEQKVAEGKFKAYGVSSNTFIVPSDAYEFTSLEKLLGIATDIASQNFFKVIQFPFNLLESGALLEQNQISTNTSTLKFAQEYNIATIANRPLNASVGDKLMRLASFRYTEPEAIIEDFRQSRQLLKDLEQRFEKEFLSRLPAELPIQTARTIFSRHQQLENGLNSFQDWEHWDHVRQYYLTPQTFNTTRYLTEHFQHDDSWHRWLRMYAKVYLNLLDTIARQYENNAFQRATEITRKLEKLAPELVDSDTLSQMALRVLTSIQGLDSVLLGMRCTPYVEDALVAMKAAPVKDAETIIESMLDYDSE